MSKSFFDGMTEDIRCEALLTLSGHMRGGRCCGVVERVHPHTHEVQSVSVNETMCVCVCVCVFVHVRKNIVGVFFSESKSDGGRTILPNGVCVSP